MDQPHKKSLYTVSFLALGLIWTAVLFSIFYLEVRHIHFQTERLSIHHARAFFQSIVTSRSWNAAHGGVYVPITEKTQPNPYLDVPDRDVVTTDGKQLTKINPAYMTRQIAEIAETRNSIHFHITSRKPIRSANKPDTWELAALNIFSDDIQEKSGFIKQPDESTIFRYMAPLWAGKECLKCHAKQGYQEGDLRGGISVSMQADSIIDSSNKQIRNLLYWHIVIWILGLAGIFFTFMLLRKEYLKRESVIIQLQTALNDVKTLSGLIPICAKCKKIRDDKGYWNQLEQYIERHSDASFSHGICEECAKELYGKTSWFKKRYPSPD